MKCQFCHQDVTDPCHDTQEVEQRATRHIERCEHALEDQDGSSQAKAGRSDG